MKKKEMRKSSHHYKTAELNCYLITPFVLIFSLSLEDGVLFKFIQDPSNCDAWLPCPGHHPETWRKPESPLSLNLCFLPATWRFLHSGGRASSTQTQGSVPSLLRASVNVCLTLPANILMSHQLSYCFISLTRLQISHFCYNEPGLGCSPLWNWALWLPDLFTWVPLQPLHPHTCESPWSSGC